MPDTLLPHIRSAFDRHEWTTFIQYVRQFSTPDNAVRERTVREQTPLTSNLLTSDRKQRSHPSGETTSETQVLINLAVQALPLVEFQTRWELVSLIAKFGYPAISPLVSLLDSFARDGQQNTGESGSKTGLEPIPSNIPNATMLGYDALEEEEEEDWDLLWFIARILGEIHHPEAIAALIQVLQTSPSEDVVTAAVMALAQQGMAAIAPLQQLLNHQPTKLVAAQALAQIFAKDPNPDLRQTLITLSNDPDATVRQVVLDALSHSHQPQVTHILLDAMTDPVAAVRRSAVIGVGLQSKVLPVTTILDALGSRLWDLDTEIRRQTAIALGRIPTRESAQLLFTALTAKDFPTPLKPDVVRALIWTNTQAGLDSLTQYLQAHHPKAPIYQEIAVMLGRVESSALYTQATQLLLDLLENHGITQQSVIIKQSIAMSLAQLKQPEAESALTQLSQDDDERVRLHAIAALKTLNIKTLNN